MWLFFSTFSCWNYAQTQRSFPNHLFAKVSFPCIRWEPGEKRAKQAEADWKKRQKLHAAVLPPQCPWKVLGGTKLQSLWCLRIRDVDRREPRQQGCCTESRRRYAGALRGTESDAEGKDFLSHISWETVSFWGEAPSCWGGYFGCPLVVCPHYPLKCLTKEPGCPPDNQIYCHPCIAVSVCLQEKCRCTAPVKGDSLWLFTEGHAGKRAAIYQGPCLVFMCALKRPVFASFPSYIRDPLKENRCLCISGTVCEGASWISVFNCCCQEVAWAALSTRIWSD